MSSSLKPFHESIVKIIEKCHEHEASLLASLIKSTIITENHDAIISAWKKRMMKFKFHDFDVPEIINKQKATNKSVKK